MKKPVDKDHGISCYRYETVQCVRVGQQCLTGRAMDDASALQHDRLPRERQCKLGVLLDESLTARDTAPRPLELDPDSAAARAAADSIRHSEGNQ